MERKMFDFSVKEIKCIPGGFKEACVIVREYLQNSTVSELRITPNGMGAVTTEEFLEATKVLMAYSWQNRENDCVPERWYCDNDCSNVDRLIFCPGEYQLANREECGQQLKLCPHYRNSQYI